MGTISSSRAVTSIVAVTVPLLSQKIVKKSQNPIGWPSTESSQTDRHGGHFKKWILTENLELPRLLKI